MVDSPIEQNGKILVILTGGRIDSVWDGNVDEIVIAKKSVIPSFFQSIDINLEFEFIEACMKDSRALTHEDREKIRHAIDNSKTSKILITHGTHTLPDTVQYLEQKLVDKDKTIIFTGSSTPLKDFSITDAGFNLGYAVAKVQELKPGIYNCANGRTLTATEMNKQLSEGKFYSPATSKRS